ncbi:MAG: anaerobic ribonucleoside-triphosphate reductase activating protein, partial [Nanoarchaeota archaeon]|nr:anaerobic ribonucleoside-triphosphate reductase activating protein [Nanoarchaeota archaeon]
KSGKIENYSSVPMLIKDIQKNTFIDYPGKIACTLFIQGCNFRCGFCHNPELMEMDCQGISKEKVLKFLEKRKKYLEGVCLTGGEPLLTLDLEFLKKIKVIGYKIKIDTNGSQPKKLKEIINKGLVDYIAMDIKCSKEKYGLLTHSKIDLKKIEQSIKIISEFPNYEFRTTVISGIHTKNEMQKIKLWLLKITKKQKLKNYYLQGFYARPDKMNNKDFNLIISTKYPLLKELKEYLKNHFEVCQIRN